MNQQIEELLARIRTLEEQLEEEFRARREEFYTALDDKRTRFAEEVIRRHKRLKIGLFRYLSEARPLVVLTAPLIYSGFVPFLLLDLFVTVYQKLCFPIYGIPRVRRRDYMVFGREDLPYLNIIEKVNCFYCSYANGLAAYLREVAGRTEQYWCPIKHARRIRDAHAQYPRFFDFGDAESFAKGLERLRKEYDKEEP